MIKHHTNRMIRINNTSLAFVRSGIEKELIQSLTYLLNKYSKKIFGNSSEMENFEINLVDEIKEAKRGESHVEEGDAHAKLQNYLHKEDNNNNNNNNIDSENNTYSGVSDVSTYVVNNKDDFQVEKNEALKDSSETLDKAGVTYEDSRAVTT